MLAVGNGTAGNTVGGLIAAASTTIGSGTQAGGLTISGGATTTGNAYFAGNVGIGTLSSAAKLHITSSVGGTDLLRLYDSGNDKTVRFYLSNPIGQGPDLNIDAQRLFVQNLYPTAITIPSGTSDFTFGNQDGTLRLRGSPVVLQTYQANTVVFEGNANADTIIRPYSSSFNIQLAPDGGNVGIGTTSPYAKLSVVGPVVAEYFHATSTSATSTFAGGLSTGSSGLNVLTNGNVGVGTAAPATVLHINSTTQPLLRLSAFGGATAFNVDEFGQATLGRNLAINPSATLSNGNDVRLSVSGAVGVTQVGNFFEVNNIHGSGGDRFVVRASGNIGIGTTSPYARLLGRRAGGCRVLPCDEYECDINI